MLSVPYLGTVLSVPYLETVFRSALNSLLSFSSTKIETKKILIKQCPQGPQKLSSLKLFKIQIRYRKTYGMDSQAMTP